MARSARIAAAVVAACCVPFAGADPCPPPPGGYSTPSELRGAGTCTAQVCSGVSGSVWITAGSVVSAFSAGQAGAPTYVGLCPRSHVQRGPGSYELRGAPRGAGFDWCGVFTIAQGVMTAAVNNSGSTQGSRCEGPVSAQALAVPFTPNTGASVNCPLTSIVPPAFQGDGQQVVGTGDGSTQVNQVLVDGQGITTCVYSTCNQDCALGATTQRQVTGPPSAGGQTVTILEVPVSSTPSGPATRCSWLRVVPPSEVGLGPNVAQLAQTVVYGSSACPTSFAGGNPNQGTSTYANWYPAGAAFSRSPLPSADPTPQTTAGGSRLPSPSRTPVPRYPAAPPVCPSASAGGTEFIPADARGSGVTASGAVTIDGSTVRITGPAQPYLSQVYCVDRVVAVPGYEPSRLYRLLSGPPAQVPAPVCILLRVDPPPGAPGGRALSLNVSTPSTPVPGVPTDAQGCPLGGTPSQFVASSFGPIVDYSNKWTPNAALNGNDYGFGGVNGDTSYFYTGREFGYGLYGGWARVAYYVNNEARVTLPLDATPAGVARGATGNAVRITTGSFDPVNSGRPDTLGCVLLAFTAPGYVSADNARYAYISTQFGSSYVTSGCNVSKLVDGSALAVNGWASLPGASPLPTLSPTQGASGSQTPTVPLTPTGSATFTPSGTPPPTVTSTGSLTVGAQPSATATQTGTASWTPSPTASRSSGLDTGGGGGGGGGGANGGGIAAAVIILLVLGAGGFYAYRKGYAARWRGKLMGGRGHGGPSDSASSTSSGGSVTVVSNVLHKAGGGPVSASPPVAPAPAQVTGNSNSSATAGVGAGAYSAAVGVGAARGAAAPALTPAAAAAAPADAVAVAVGGGEQRKDSFAPVAAGSQSAAASAAPSAIAPSAIAQSVDDTAAAVDSIVDLALHAAIVVPSSSAAAAAALVPDEAAAAAAGTPSLAPDGEAGVGETVGAEADPAAAAAPAGAAPDGLGAALYSSDSSAVNDGEAPATTEGLPPEPGAAAAGPRDDDTW